jgi:hypothetical protein
VVRGASFEDLREDVGDGVPDERLVAGLDMAVRELEGPAVEGTGDQAGNAATGARRTVAGVGDRRP